MSISDVSPQKQTIPFKARFPKRKREEYLSSLFKFFPFPPRGNSRFFEEVNQSADRQVSSPSSEFPICPHPQ